MHHWGNRSSTSSEDTRHARPDTSSRARGTRFARGSRFALSFVALISVLGLAVGPLAFNAGAQTETTTETTPQAEPPAPPEVTPEEPPAAPETPAEAPVAEEPAPAPEAPATDATTPSTDATTPSSAPAEDAPLFPELPPDDDGVSPGIESGAPNGGDGNSDGTPDADQAHVASLPSKYDVDGNGALDDYITIESPLFTSIANARTLLVPADNPPPEGAVLPAGLIDYDVHVITEGDSADVKLYLPGGEQSAVYMLQDGAWKNFDASSSINDGADEVVLNLKDGGAGDDSGVNGVINDPVGVAQPNTNPPTANANATIVVRNDNLPEPGVSFQYQVFDCGTAAAPPATIAGCTAGTTNAAIGDGATTQFAGLLTDNHWYRVQRAATPAGWGVASIVCSDNSADPNAVDTANRHGAVRLVAGTTGGACSFVNAQDGTVTVIKQTDVEGNTQSFPVHLQRCGPGNNDTACGGGNPFVTPNNVSISDNGQQTWTAADISTAGGFAGRFEITENLTGGATLTSAECTGGTGLSQKSLLTNGRRFFATNATPGIVCTLTNDVKVPGDPGTITLTKQTTPDGSTQSFTTRLRRCGNAAGDTCGGGDPFVIPDNQNVTDGQSAIWGPGAANMTLPGKFELSETLPAGWTLTSPVTCTGGTGVQNVTTGTNDVEFFLSAANSLSTSGLICTFNNAGPPPPTITVHKGGTRGGGGNGLTYANGLGGATFAASTVGENGPFNIPLCVTLAVAAPPLGVGDCTSGPLSPNTEYWVAETVAPAGYTNPTSLVYGGTSTGSGNQTHQYVGHVETGSTGTFEPEYQINNGGTQQSPHRVINVRNNNPTPNTCGTSVSLILDESGSIGNDAPTYAAAAKSMIDSLAGSPTTVHISSFSNGSSDAPNSPFNLALNPGTATTGVTGAKNAIDAIYASVGGGTNWDAGLMEAVGNGSAMSIFLTDGNPTTWDGSPNGGGGTITLNDLEAGIAAANSLKATGTNLIAVGAGANVTASNLALIANDDVFLSDISQLQATLSNLANQLCGSRIHVRKLINGNLTNGWSFAGTSTAAGSSVAYPNGQLTGQGGNPTGEMTVNVNNVPVAPGTNVTVTETVQPTFSFVDGQCRTGGTAQNPYTTGSVAGSVANAVATINGVLRNQDYYCTFNNIQNPGNIIIEKIGVGSGPGAGFTFSGAGTPFGANGLTLNTPNNGGTVTSQTYQVPANTGAGYTVSENAPLPAGWDFSTLTCTNPDGQNPSVVTGQSVAIKVSANETVKCTWTNTKRGNVIIKKTAVGGDETFNYTGPAPINGRNVTTVGGTGQTVAIEVAPNTTTGYAVVENALPAGWDFTSLACSDGDSTVNGQTATYRVAAGETVTCTWTNTKRGNVIIKKTAVGGNETFNYTGPAPINGRNVTTVGGTGQTVAIEVAPNTTTGYAVVENALPAGWDFTSLACSDGDSTVNGQTATYRVAAGETVTCTWTNTKRGNVIIKKTAVGGNETFNYTGPAPINGRNVTTVGGTGQTVAIEVAPNTTTGYAVVENALPAGWDFTSLACSDGDSTVNGQTATYRVGPGETVTCTWTNTKRGNVIIKKNTVGGNDTFSYTGPAPINGRNVTTVGNTGQTAAIEVTPNTTSGYAVAENGPPAGWAFTTLTCDDADSTVNGQTATYRVGPGETVTCTWTNTKGGAIIIKKTAVGGNDTFNYTAAAPVGNQQVTTTGGTGQTVAIPVTPNTTTGYTVTEAALPAGWDFSQLVCDDADSTVNGQAATYRVGAGETVTCTWTNTKRGNVIIKKTAVGGDETFNYTGPAPINGRNVTTVGGTGQTVAIEVVPNTTTGYAVVENALPAGWDFTSLACSDGDSTVNGQTATYRVGPGETVTCTWTNTKRGNVIIKKSTVGGDDTFSYAGPAPINGRNVTTVGNTGQTAAIEVLPNTTTGYAVVENGPPSGWAFTTLTCSDGDSTVSGQTATYRVSPGETVTCTWTNTKDGAVIIKKTAVGGNDTFNYTANAPVGNQQVTTAGGTGQTAAIAVTPNTGAGYVVTESGPPNGWAFTTLVCDDADSTVNGQAATYRVSPGETVTCTWTNTKDGAVIIKKTAVGGNDTFNYTANAPVGNQQVTTSGGTGQTTAIAVAPNTGAGYVVTESGPPNGWDFSQLVCDDADSTVNGQAATYRVSPGETVTCTWTNTKRGNIIIKKTGVGAGPGAGFVFSGAGTPFGPNGLTLTTQTGGSTETSQSYEVTPNSVNNPYVVSENAPLPAGWSFSNVTCDNTPTSTDQIARSASIVVAPGETVTCTWTNTKGASVTIVKSGVGAGPGGAFNFPVPAAFGEAGNTLTLNTPNGGGDVSKTYPVAPNTAQNPYVVSESLPLPAGWDFTNLACTAGGTTDQENRSASIVVGPGGSVTCTWTNTKRGHVIIAKTAIGGNDTFGYTGPAPINGRNVTTVDGSGQTTAIEVQPNTTTGYAVSENAPPAGWDFTTLVCDDLDSGVNGQTATYKVSPGETVTCTWTNTKRGNVIIKKTGVGQGPGAGFIFSGGGTPFGTDGLTLTTQTGGSTETSTTYSVAPNSLENPYVVSENAPPAGWDFSNVQCDDDSSTSNANRSASIVVSPGETVTCTWTNTKRGNVIIKKTGIGQGPGAGFVFSGGGTPFGTNGLTLTTQTDGSTETSTTYSVAPNSLENPYAVSENNPPAGWDFTNLACSDNSGTNQGTRTASIVVSPGETVTCTWTNTKRGNVIIQKTGIGQGPGAGFVFSGGGTPFGADGLTLTTQTDGSTETSTTYSVAPNSSDNPYTVSENNPPAGWDFTNVECDNTPTQTSQPNRSAAIVVGAGETVTCTWTNTKRANVIIQKTGIGQGPGAGFVFSGGGTPFGADGLTLTTQTGGSTETSQTYSVAPNAGGSPGPYVVSENAPPAGWAFTSLSCNNDSGTDQAARSASIVVGPGQTVTCTWVNTKGANVIIQKTGIGQGPGAGFVFSGGGTPFGADGLTLNTPADGGTATSSTFPVAPNTGENPYVVSENAPPAGWDFTNVACDDDSSTSQPNRSASIVVGPGETVTCTWTNTKRGNVIIQKTGVGQGEGAGFIFSGGGTPFGVDGLTLSTPADGGTATSSTYSVAPNTGENPYVVSENTPPAGWDFTNVACDDSSSTSQPDRSASIVVSPGETVTCTWTNTKRGNIVVEKQTTPNGDPTAFDFSASYDADGFSLSDGQTSDSGLLEPGAYDVAENTPDGWTLASATCDDGSEPGEIDLAAGETVTCTFNNTLNTASVTVVKHVSPDLTTDVAGWEITGNLPDAASDPGRFTVIPPNTNPVVSVPDREDAVGTTTDGSAPDGPLTFTLDHVSNTGTTVGLLETLQEEFSFGSFACEGGGAVQTAGRGGTVVVETGDEVVCTFVNDPAGIGLTKTPSPNTVQIGDSVDFTLTATNTADVPLHDLLFTDTLDPRFQFDAAGSDALCSANHPGPQDIECGLYFPVGDAPRLEPGDDFSINIRVTVVGGAAGDVIPNPASVSALPPDGPEVSANAETSVNIVEVLATGEIIVEKRTTPDPTADGPFPVTVRGGPAGFDQTVDLARGGDRTTFIVTDGPGYSVSERVPSGWTLTGIECTADGSAVELDANNLTVEGGSVTTCVVSNNRIEVSTVTGRLPFTGTSADTLIRLAFALIVIGGGLVLIAALRRRREAGA